MQTNEAGTELPAWGAFNGQIGRRAIVEALLDVLELRACVETGTYRGDTAAALAERGRLVFTVEVDDGRLGAARARFAGDERVRVSGGDSRAFLRGLTNEPECPLQRVLFYLDAHWYRDVPLREEVDWIARHWRRSVILVDDFQVPHDDGYGYDAYAGGPALTADYLRGVGEGRLRWFWPVLPARLETGARRGCVVLVWEAEMAEELSRVPLLREQTP